MSGNQRGGLGRWRSRHWRGRGRRRGKAPEVKSGLVGPPSSSPQPWDRAVRRFGLSCSRATVKCWRLCSPLTSAIIWNEFQITFDQCRPKTNMSHHFNQYMSPDEPAQGTKKQPLPALRWFCSILVGPILSPEKDSLPCGETRLTHRLCSGADKFSFFC